MRSRVGAVAFLHLLLDRFHLVLGTDREPGVLGSREDVLHDPLGGERAAAFAVPLTVLDQLELLRDQLHVEALGDLVHAVPVGVVGRHHRGPVAGAPSLVVPQVEPGPLDLLVELGVAEHAVGA